ncbi:MAG: hypothetical protein R3332_05775 [Pseudohongiellaceae bacterium]|nr:hypothetical protein [Pseudohongiellaceae bacterium]
MPKLSNTLAIRIVIAASAMCLGSSALSEDSLSHHQDYEAALNITLNSEERITTQMSRLLIGEVKHFDFLQFEHIELMRHARALAHPPSDVSEEAKEEIKREADALMSASLEIEWIIADFLQEYAQVRSATSNILDIVSSLEDEKDAALRSKLHSIKAQTQQLVLNGYQDDWEELNNSLSRVLASDIGAQAKAELDFQKAQLAHYLPTLAKHIKRVENGASDEIAKRLEQAYRSKAT